MALSIKNQEIIGEIDKLEEKLEGKLPVDRLELLVLVNSWGRTNFSYTEYLNEDVKIEKCKEKECYDLSKLDVSQITNMDSVFCFSNFNCDLGNWDVSNVTNMLDMFFFAKKFNSPLNDWDVSNVIDMNYMFFEAISFNQDISKWDVSKVKYISYMFANTLEFNQNISSWNLENIINCDCMFNKAESFIDKYNSSEPLPYKTEDIKKWFNLNRDRMNAIDIKEKYGKEVDSFFSKFSNKEISKEI